MVGGCWATAMPDVPRNKIRLRIQKLIFFMIGSLLK
jgi:hypothetical protein